MVALGDSLLIYHPTPPTKLEIYKSGSIHTNNVSFASIASVFQIIPPGSNTLPESFSAVRLVLWA